VGELVRLDQIVLGLAQHLIPLGVLQPQIHLDCGHVFHCPQSPLLCCGLLVLDFLNDLVVDFILTMLSITAAVGIVGIAGFLPYVPDCGLVGLALLGNLLALIHDLIPLPLPTKP
jgi:hypothetical protein